MRCPVLVSRAKETARLRDALALTGSDRGAVVVLRGEPGVGKSRLVADVLAQAREARLTALTGRAVLSSSPLPLRPLGEALLGWLRTEQVPDDAGLAPYLPALGGLAPQLAVQMTGVAPADPGPPSVMLIGEALLRLARAVPGGALLVVEDLHWADPETLGVLEYVADNVRDVPLVVVTTTRPHDVPHVSELVDALERRGSAEVLDVAPLAEGAVVDMVGACLGGAVPAELERLVRRYSAGFPLLVEEILSDLVGTGALVRTDGDDPGWVLTERPELVVPKSFARSIETRLEQADPVTREVMEAAAILGEHFDWQVVVAALGLDDRATAAAIRELRDRRLVVPSGDGFAIRHALVREAVLARMLAPDRTRVAAALATALAERADGPVDAAGQSGEAQQHLAELFEAAGEHDRAAQQWLWAARTALTRGALVSALDALGRAGALVPEDSSVGLDVREATVEAHALAGDPPSAMAVAEPLIARLEEMRADPERLAALRLRVARFLLAGGRWDEAAAMLDLAPGYDPGLEGVLRARVALGRLDDPGAIEIATAALEVVGEDRPEVACEAWEVIGRAHRGDNVVAAEEAFEEGYRIAETHGLELWRVRNLGLLGSLDLIQRRPTDDRLLAALAAALRLGAIATAARIELDLTMLKIRTYELEEAAERVERALPVMQRLRLPDLSIAHMFRAHLAGLQGRNDEMEAEIARGLEVSDSDPMMSTGAWGHVRAPSALAHGRYEEARSHFAEAMVWVRKYPGLPFSLRGLWALLESVLADGADAREEVRSGPQASAPFNHFCLRAADAVALGRAGDAEGAARIFADVEGAMPGREPWHELHARLLVAKAAAADGWGDPERWFRSVLDGFVDNGITEGASVCRVEMREAGFAVPRRTTGGSRVSAHLQALGVTAREYDVLLLVADGASNRDIAERLFLSVRTVETHVARLLQRTGAADRGELGGFLAGS